MEYNNFLKDNRLMVMSATNVWMELCLALQLFIVTTDEERVYAAACSQIQREV